MALVCLAACDGGPQSFAAPTPPGAKLLRVPRPAGHQYIVVLKQGPSTKGLAAVQATANALRSRYGGRRVHLYQHAVKGFSARMTAAQAASMASDPRVKYVEEDAVMTLATTQQDPPWGLDRVDQHQLPVDRAYTYDTTGKGVHAYIIDTGIRVSHEEFEQRANGVFTAIQDGHGADDGHGHGTRVAGIIGSRTYGIAKGVQLHAVRVVPWGARTTEASNLIAGVDWVTGSRSDPAVANISIAGGPSRALEDAVRASIHSGVTYVIGAGNQDMDACVQSPAGVEEAITVGSTDLRDTRAHDSNYGRCLDLFAPGVNIPTTDSASDTATFRAEGTSMAAPHVTGVVARFLERNPRTSAISVAQRIVELATQGVVWNRGTGSPNKLLFAPAIEALPFAGQLEGIVHVQDLGDRRFEETQWAGTKGRRLEGVSLQLVPPVAGLSLEYMCHLQGYGDQPWMPAGNFCGTRGQARRLEGFALRLTGPNADRYDVFYECSIQGLGEYGPMRNGAYCGTRGQSRPLEALTVWVVPRSAVTLQGLAHLQELGDRRFQGAELAGTRWQSRRLEGFSFSLAQPVTGLGIEYMCHLQGLGDQSWMPGGSFCGTRGQSRRLEGLAVRLTGPMASHYDVYYLCHLQETGDTGLMKNGAFCGTRGQSRRLEAFHVWVAPRF